MVQVDSKNIPKKTGSRIGQYISLGVIGLVIAILLSVVAYKIVTTEKISKKLVPYCVKGYCLFIVLNEPLFTTIIQTNLNMTLYYLSLEAKQLAKMGVETIVLKNLVLNSTTIGNRPSDLKKLVKSVRFYGIGLFVEISLQKLSEANKFIESGIHGFVIEYDSKIYSTSNVDILYNKVTKIKSPVKGSVILSIKDNKSLQEIKNNWKLLAKNTDIFLLPFSAIEQANPYLDADFYTNNKIIYDTIVKNNPTLPSKWYKIFVTNLYQYGSVINQNQLFIYSNKDNANSKDNNGVIMQKDLIHELDRQYKFKSQFDYYQFLSSPTVHSYSQSLENDQDNVIYILRQNTSTRKKKFSKFLIIYSRTKQNIDLSATNGQDGYILYDYPQSTKFIHNPIKINLKNIILNAGSVMMIGIKTINK